MLKLLASRRKAWVFEAAVIGLVLLWAGLLCYLLRGLYFVGMYNDDTVYLGIARALVHGRGYVNPVIHPLQPEIRYPFGFPLFLAFGQWLSHASLVEPRWQCFATAELCLVALYIYLRRFPRAESESPLWSGAVAFLTGNCVLFASLGTSVMSDIPYLWAVAMWLAVSERRRWGPISRSAAVYITLLTLLCWSFRAVGVLLVPCLAAIAVEQPAARRGLLWIITACSAVMVPYLGLQAATGYGGATHSLRISPAVIAQNFTYHAAGIPLSLWTDPARWAPQAWTHAWTAILCLLTWVLVVRGWRSCWQRGLRLSCWYSLANILLLFLFPFGTLLGARYDLIVLPFVCLYTLEGALLCPGRRKLAAGLAVLICAVQVATWLPLVGIRSKVTGLSTLAWLRNHPVGSCVCSTDTDIWLYTGQPIFPAGDEFVTQHPEAFVAALFQNDCRRLATPVDSTLARWAWRHPEWVQPEAGVPRSALLVFKLVIDRKTYLRAYADYQAGQSWLLQGEYARAVALFRRALRREPAMPNVHTSMAVALWRQHKPRLAVQELDQALQLDPNLLRARALRAALR